MPVVLQSAVPEQFGEVLAFWRDCTEVASFTDDRAGLAILYAHDPDALIVALDEGDIVGTVIATWDGWRAGFYRLAFWRAAGYHHDAGHARFARNL